MTGPQYTSCVQPQDYEGLDLTAEEVTALAGAGVALATAGFGLAISGVAAVWALRRAVDYMLNGKLVCLGGDRCAIGHIAGFEPVGYQKSFPENIDNDWSVNIVLAPASLHDYVGNDERENLKRARALEPQGTLLDEPKGLAKPPREPKENWGNYGGYFTKFNGPDWGTRIITGDKDTHVPAFPSKNPFPVPVLHCECEGNRIYLIKQVLDNMPPGIGAVCKVKVLGIPVGAIGCAIANFLALPFIAAALVAAWAAASGGDPADAGAGELKVGDAVLVTGRWVYDAGHSGYNEIHAVKTIQKLPADGPYGAGGFKDYYAKACALALQAPPREETAEKGQGLTSEQAETGEGEGLTAEQAETRERQSAPENQWMLHPAVDGCRPSDERKREDRPDAGVDGDSEAGEIINK